MRRSTWFNNSQEPFVSVWKTDNGGIIPSASNQVALPLANTGVLGGLNINVDWGDGNSDYAITDPTDSRVVHTYLSAGTYTIKITGTMSNYWSFNAGYYYRDNDKILEVSDWGDIVLDNSNQSRTFWQCSNLVITAENTYEAIIKPNTQFYEYFRLCSSITSIPGMDTWDMSHVVSLQGMFSGCNLDATVDVSGWNISSNCLILEAVFAYNTNFASEFTTWDTSGCSDFASMVLGCTSITNEDFSVFQVKGLLIGMFSGCINFTGNGLETWDTSLVTNMSNLFVNCNSFDVSKVEGWNVSGVTNFYRVFLSNNNANMSTLDLTGWDVSNATNISDMFGASSFSGNVSGWTLKTGATINASYLFRSCPFNGTINDWTNTSSITNMYQMFSGNNSFNQDMNLWDVSNVTDFRLCFNGASSFNGNIDNWDVSSGTRFDSMFYNTDSFTRDISGWNVSGGTHFYRMFMNSDAFNLNLGGWDIRQAVDISEMFRATTSFTTANYDAILVGWENLTPPPTGLTLDSITVGYTETAVETGTTDASASNKLIDAGQNFLTTVTIGDIVHNTTDDTFTDVTNIDNDGQLSISDDIMVSGETYTIQSSNSAKARYSLINNYGWTIIDGGPV